VVSWRSLVALSLILGALRRCRRQSTSFKCPQFCTTSSLRFGRSYTRRTLARFATRCVLRSESRTVIDVRHVATDTAVLPPVPAVWPRVHSALSERHLRDEENRRVRRAAAAAGCCCHSDTAAGRAVHARRGRGDGAAGGSHVSSRAACAVVVVVMVAAAVAAAVTTVSGLA
jgi:hypothetical protein